MKILKVLTIISISIFSGLFVVESANAESSALPKNAIIVFVSFSMPKQSLKYWLLEAQKINAPVIIRGLINNSFKDTIAKTQELLGNNTQGFQLDPTLFQRYQITQVPAVVVTNENVCLPQATCVGNYDVVYGNTTLDYALEKISQQNDSLTPAASDALKILRGKKL